MIRGKGKRRQKQKQKRSSHDRCRCRKFLVVGLYAWPRVYVRPAGPAGMNTLMHISPMYIYTISGICVIAVRSCDVEAQSAGSKWCFDVSLIIHRYLPGMLFFRCIHTVLVPGLRLAHGCSCVVLLVFVQAETTIIPILYSYIRVLYTYRYDLGAFCPASARHNLIFSVPLPIFFPQWNFVSLSLLWKRRNNSRRRNESQQPDWGFISRSLAIQYQAHHNVLSIE